MDIRKLSSCYDVKALTMQDIDAIYELSVGNPLFYKHCPPFVTKESIAEDMKALPPGKTYEDKHYTGFWENGKLAALLDLITGYPNEKTAYIGLFMMNHALQGMGIGSRIITECENYLKASGYSFIRLAYAKGNKQSERFWKKNGFENTGIEIANTGYTAVVLQKTL